ncbi:methyl-accepting chemotaxis protein [Endothiovibrio diazotrophicus]
MNALANLPFRFKIAIPILLVAALAVLSAVVGIFSIRGLAKEADAIAEKRLPAIDYLLQADRDLYQAQVAERTLLLAQVDAEQQKALVEQNRENIQQARDRVGKFRNHSNAPEEARLVEQFYALLDQWKATSSQIVEERYRSPQGDPTALLKLSLGRGDEQFQAAREVIDHLTELVEKAASGERASIERTAADSLTQLLTVLVVNVAICIAMVLFLPPLITRPLNEMLERVKDISQGNGDLTARVDVAGRDEVGLLAAELNQFLTTLQHLIREVAGTTEQVANAAEELSVITRETGGNIDEQRGATDQVATAVTELTATVHEVARNAEDAAGSAHQADENSRRGHEVVASAVEAIERLAADVERTAVAIGELEANSQNIGGVLDVIRGIAEQTNLLALNAAIEAARAGEQGRGFAVVADEVRTLASRTQQSTQEIQQMIEGLQSGSRNAVEVMEVARGNARTSVDQAGGAASALEEITRAVAKISDMNTQIATAAQEQSAVTEEINRNIVAISTAAEHNADSSDRVTDASNQLAGLSDNLKRLVGRFKVA